MYELEIFDQYESQPVFAWGRHEIGIKLEVDLMLARKTQLTGKRLACGWYPAPGCDVQSS